MCTMWYNTNIIVMKGVFIMGTAKSVNMNIRMDEITKKQAQQLFSEFGLDMTTAINMFLKQSVREQRIPFELRARIPNNETLKAIKESEKGIGMSKIFHSPEELFEDLEI